MSRSGQKTTKTFAKIAFRSTGPNVRLSIAALRLSPRTKYCSFGTSTGGNGCVVDVVELDPRSRRHCRHGPRSDPRGRAATRSARTRSLASRSGDDGAVGSVSRHEWPRLAALRITDLVREALREARPLQAGIVVAMTHCRRSRPARRSSAKSRTTRATATITTIASARVIQRSMPLLPFPETAVAAPACSSFTRGGDCGVVYVGGDA